MVVKVICSETFFFSAGYRTKRMIHGNGSYYRPTKAIVSNNYPKKECKSNSQCKSSEICHDTGTSQGAFCVPKKKCTRNKDCPYVGSPISGIIGGRCISGKCAYGQGVLIAE